MAAPNPKNRLGRGLAALIGDDLNEEAAVDNARTFRQVPIETLRANPENPRKTFTQAALDELAASIKTKGVVQPIVVRAVPGEAGGFEIVAGERRWRAAQAAGLHQVPVLIREVSDAEALEIAIIENVQRSDLNPMEEAEGYQRLMDHFGHTQQQLADMLAKSRSHIANTLRLTALPHDIQDYLRDGRLTAGHARALITAQKNRQSALAAQIIDQGLTVREAEQLAQAGAAKKAAKSPGKARPEKGPDTLALERNLSSSLGLAIEINERAGGGGELKIRYRTLEQLDDLCTRLLRHK